MTLKQFSCNYYTFQKRQGQPNSMSTSEKFTYEEDGGTGFWIEPPKGAAPNAGWMMNVKEDEALMITGHNSSRSGQEESRPQRSYVDKAAAQLSRFSNSVTVRGSSRYNSHREAGGRYDRLDGGESSVKPDWAHHLLDQPDSLDKQGREVSGKQFTMVRCKFSKIYQSCLSYESVFCPFFFAP